MPEYVPPEPVDLYVVYEGADLPEPDLDAPLIEHRYERSEPVVYGSTWDMAAWIAADRARRAAEGAFDAGGESELVAPSWRVEIAELPKGKGSARAIAQRAADAGFEVRCQASIVYVTPTLFAASKEADGAKGHTKGDLRFGDRDDTWWGVQAVLRRQGTVVAAFWAEWRTKESVGKRPTTAFADAMTFDIVTKRDLYAKAGDFAAWFDVFAPPPSATNPSRAPASV